MDDIVKNNWIEEMFKKRFEKDFSLRSVGHGGLSLEYNQYMYKQCLRTLNRVLKLNHITLKDKKILDIGAGNGYFIENFYKKNNCGSITGLDITDISVKYLTDKYPEYTFKKMDISSDNVDIFGQYDIISMFNMIFHIVDEAGFDNAINNIKKLSTPGGYLFINDMFSRVELQYVTPHVRFRSLKRWRNVLEKNGIEIVGLYPLYFLLDHPRDIREIHLQNFMVKLWDIMMTLDRFKVTRTALLSSLYHIDGLLSRYCGDCHTTKLMLCRV